MDGILACLRPFGTSSSLPAAISRHSAALQVLPHVANYRGCPAYKDQAFRQHVVQKQISYASVLKQASPPPTSNTFSFTAEQIVSLVTNVVIQIAQPQLCTKNLPEKQTQAKSDLSKQIAETAKKCLKKIETAKKCLKC